MLFGRLAVIGVTCANTVSLGANEQIVRFEHVIGFKSVDRFENFSDFL